MMRKAKENPLYRIESPIVVDRVSFVAAIALMLCHVQKRMILLLWVDR
jgi:hypothetical protein